MIMEIAEQPETHILEAREFPPLHRQSEFSPRRQFGAELEAMKNKRGLTQGQLAEAAELTPTSIANLLLGRGRGGNIFLSHIFRLAEALSCRLIVGETAEWNHKTSIKDVFAHGGSLTPIELSRPRKKK